MGESVERSNTTGENTVHVRHFVQEKVRPLVTSPEFRAPTRTARSRGASVYVAQHEGADSGEPKETSIGEDDGPAVQFQELESFLARHGRAFEFNPHF